MTFVKRNFHQLPSTPDSTSIKINGNSVEKVEDLLKFISNDIIGRDYEFDSPFGRRSVIYCDYIASGRALLSIEKYLQEKILPAYGNTHTSTTVTSLQSSMFLQEARMMIRNSVRASEHDAVIFVGNGVTGAVNKLIHALNFKRPPVVFVGPFEHHSNLLPWREIAAHVVYISENKQGKINLHHLEEALKLWQTTGLEMIGCFSAASNITGIVSDTVSITEKLHQYGCLALWDYATGGPYLDIDMHPVGSKFDASKDAVFLSMHKFVGGVDCPGVLVAKKSLFRNQQPSECGGGAVFFVSRSDHRFLQEVEMREEAGTIRVIGAVRAALAIKLKDSVGCEEIMKIETKLRHQALKVWRKIPHLKLLGEDEEDQHRLAVFSFLIQDQISGKYLHHNFVAALLNDLFGIQTRGGCACAGPYAQDLLGIDVRLSLDFENALREDSRLDRTHLRRQTEHSSFEVLRPGFTRLNFSYFCSDDEADFIIRAVAFVANHGSKFLPRYMFNPETAEWKHIKHKVFSDRRWIEHTSFTSRGLIVTDPTSRFTASNPPENFDQILAEADKLSRSPFKGVDLPDHSVMFSNEVTHLRWFLLPSEAQMRHNHASSLPPVFIPRSQFKELTPAEIEEDICIPGHIEDLLQNLDAEKDNEDTFRRLRLNEETRQIKSDEDLCSTGACTLKRRDKPQDVAVVDSAPQRRFISPPKSLMKPSIQAIKDFQMIKDGDKVLVCLSGGKDSLSLLHVLHQYQYQAKKEGIHFKLGAVTVDPMTSAYDPSPLIPYLSELGLTYFFERQDIFDQAMNVSAASICSFCSRMKRGRLYACARREGWNVLAFGQHLDDLAETFLMSSFHNGILFTMKANYEIKEGDLRVIRPFVYVRETLTRQFAESNRLPVIPENCPACFEAPKERHRIKQLLASQEILHPRIFHNLRSTMKSLMSRNIFSADAQIEEDEL